MKSANRKFFSSRSSEKTVVNPSTITGCNLLESAVMPCCVKHLPVDLDKERRRKTEPRVMADEIEQKLLEQVKEQGEIVRKLKAAKANDTEVRSIIFTYHRLIFSFAVNFF